MNSPQPIATTQITPEVEAAELAAYKALDDIWNAADGMSIGNLTAVFLRVRDKIDHNIQELGH